MKRIATMTIALVCAFVGTQAAAATTVIYRCTDAGGTVTFQNGSPCPKGHAQERRVIEMDSRMPSYTPPPAAAVTPPQVPLISRMPAVPDASAGETGPDAERAPPPALFTCRVYDNSVYWREDDAPPMRCRPLQTVGIGGLPGMAAGQACEQIADTCEAVPEAALCSSWETRVREAEFRWRYAQDRAQDPLRLEYEQLFKTWRESTCGPGEPANRAQNQRGTTAR
ncbi:MAG: DUF4124 domain-containing protein [Luteimonas sp.]